MTISKPANLAPWWRILTNHFSVGDFCSTSPTAPFIIISLLPRLLIFPFGHRDSCLTTWFDTELSTHLMEFFPLTSSNLACEKAQINWFCLTNHRIKSTRQQILNTVDVISPMNLGVKLWRYNIRIKRKMFRYSNKVRPVISWLLLLILSAVFHFIELVHCFPLFRCLPVIKISKNFLRYHRQ